MAFRDPSQRFAMQFLRPLVLAASTLVLSGPLLAAPQSTPELRYSAGAIQGAELGFEADGLGDVTGDGFPDLLVSARMDRDPVTGVSGVGTVRTYDGRTGELLSLVAPPDGTKGLGRMARAVGDLNGDGVGDYAAGAEQPASILIFSGADHALLQTWSDGNVFFGRQFDDMGDWNGDGVPDVATAGFKNISNPGWVRIHSGTNGAVLAQITPSASPFANFANSMTTLADLNGDGVRDIAVGAPGQEGKVYVYSGASLAEMMVLTPPLGSTNLGFTVREAGDINGDGVPDIAAGAPQDQANAGSVSIFSGATGALIHHVVGDPGDRLGFVAQGVGDVNGDGVLDFAGGGTAAKLFSGADGSLLQSYFVSGSLFRSAVPLGDVNGDGLAEVALGNSVWPNANGGGGVMAMSAQVADAYGEEPSATQTLTSAWQPGAFPTPANGRVSISGAAPSATGVLFGYTQPADLPEFAPGLRLLIDPASTLLFQSFFAFDGAGQFEIPINLATPGAAGAHFYTQAFELGAPTPSGFHTSNGLLILFQG